MVSSSGGGGFGILMLLITMLQKKNITIASSTKKNGDPRKAKKVRSIQYGDDGHRKRGTMHERGPQNLRRGTTRMK